MRVWDLEAGTAVHTLTGHDGGVTAVAVSADSRWVTAVAVSPDGRRAVSGYMDGTVRIWDLATGKQIASAGRRLQQLLTRFQSFVGSKIAYSEHLGYIRSTSAGGGRAVSGRTNGTVQVWDLETGRAVHTLTGHDGGVTSVAVSPDGRRAVSGGGDGTVQVWDLETPAVRTLTGHDGGVTAVAVSADGRRAVSGGTDGMVRVWDVAHGVKLASFAAEHSITVLAVTSPGTPVIVGTSAGPVHLLELCAYE